MIPGVLDSITSLSVESVRDYGRSMSNEYVKLLLLLLLLEITLVSVCDADN